MVAEAAYSVIVLHGRRLPPEVYGPEPYRRAMARAESLCGRLGVSTMELDEGGRLITVDARSKRGRFRG